jgi:hypothetical protein
MFADVDIAAGKPGLWFPARSPTNEKSAESTEPVVVASG